MITMTTTFPTVNTTRQRTGKCTYCGKRTVRRQSFTHTINPFNRNEDGSIRTPEEVRACVNGEADAWIPDFDHYACKEQS